MKGTESLWKSSKQVETNPRAASVANLRRLVVSRDEREKTGLFYGEGMRFVSHAALAQAPIECLVVAPELLTHAFGQRLWRDLTQRGLPTLRVSAEIYASLSRVGEPQGIGAVVRQKWDRLSRTRPKTNTGIGWIALDTVRSPGNLGTVLRTAESVGASGLFLIGDSIDPYAPDVVRATMGALFGLRFVRTDLPALTAWRRRYHVPLIGTSPHAADDYRASSYRLPAVLWLGGERKGLSDEQQAVCDRVVRIPMVGRSDSLNLGVAAGVLLYELFHQRTQTRP